MLEIILVALSLILIVGAFAIDRSFLLSPLFHFALFFLLFIVGYAGEARSAYFVPLVMLGAVAFACGYALMRVTAPKVPWVQAVPMDLAHRSLTLTRLGGLYLVGAAIQFQGQLTLSGISLEAFLECPICETSLTGKKNVAATAAFYTVVLSWIDVKAYQLLKQDPRWSVALMLGVFRMVFYAASLGTGRVALLIHLALPVLLLALIRRDLMSRMRQCVLLAGGGLMLLPALYGLNILRHGQLEGTFDFLEIVTSFKSDLNPGENLDHLFRYIDNQGFDFGFFLVSPLIALIPRDLFVDKPITSLQFFYTERIFNTDPILDVTTYTFTLFDSYSAFGVVSLVLVTIAYGMFFAKIYQGLSSRHDATVIFCAELCLGAINIYRTNLFDAIVFLILRYLCLWLFAMSKGHRLPTMKAGTRLS